MIDSTLAIAAFILLWLSGALHILFGPGSQRHTEGLTAYAMGLGPILLAFAFVQLLSPATSSTQPIVNLVVLVAAAAAFPVLGRLIAAWRELEDRRFTATLTDNHG